VKIKKHLCGKMMLKGSVRQASAKGAASERIPYNCNTTRIRVRVGRCSDEFAGTNANPNLGNRPLGLLRPQSSQK
jgi:hypothetical protein